MRRLIAVGGGAALLLVACSPDPADFREQAESYIETRDFSEQIGQLRYSNVDCEDPEDTNVDTRFTCTAEAEDGSRWLFTVEITGSKELTVLRDPAPLSRGDDDVTATSPPDTEAVSPAAEPGG
jgi:hypothetical protein